MSNRAYVNRQKDSVVTDLLQAGLNPAVPPSVELDHPALANLIESRTLIRECLTGCFKAALGNSVISYPSLSSWIEADDRPTPSVIVLSVEAGRKGGETLEKELDLLAQLPASPPVMLLSDDDEPESVTGAVEQGARGYIPTSATLAVAIEAMRLVRAGGKYFPVESLLQSGRSAASAHEGKSPSNGLLTARQEAVLEGLRKGKANKTIAYELNMRESTVKIHVRNILKRLGAKNRTEVAYMAHEMFRSQDH